MSKRPKIHVHIGYAVGTGDAVSIDLAHIFVAGQTQTAGKTTALLAIVSRSGCRALAFVTKRGEEMEGRMIRPYLPREGDEQIHWRYVETIMASAVGQKGLKFERLQIIAATENARSLEDVRRNITRLQEKAKKGSPSAGIYELLGAYLDLVLPEMRAMKATGTLDLQPGLNVMDLVDLSPDMQALVIGAAIQRINEHEKGVLVVFPEAWQFAPRDRNTAARFQAEKMARVGAVLGNFLLTDSQDIIGVSQVMRDASTNWLIGVQRSDNELKRGLNVIKTSGAAAPKPSEIGTLTLGQFFVCHGRTAIKTYVQPAWMSDKDARAVAMGGEIPAEPVHKPIHESAPTMHAPPARMREKPPAMRKPAEFIPPTQPAAPAQPESENDMGDNSETNALLRQLLEKISGGNAQAPAAVAAAAPAVPAMTDGEDALYQRIKARLLVELPIIAAGGPTTLTPPEKLRKDFQRDETNRIIDKANSLRPLAKKVLRLVETADEFITQPAIAKRLGRSDGGNARADLGKAVKELTAAGFVESRQGNGVRKALHTKITEDLAHYKATPAEIDAVYHNVLHHIASEGGSRE